MISSHFLKAQDTAKVCPIDPEEIKNNSVMNVFPNPTNHTFQIVYGSLNKCPPDGWGGMLIVQIVNSYYNIVYSETILVFEGEYNNTIDLRTLEKGIYTIELVVGKRKIVRREVLQ